MGTYPVLDQILLPEDLRRLPESELPKVCAEVREYIIDTLSTVGGHFASNLGVVELTVALHYVFQTPIDKLIWDVGHQIYPHKVLTGRKDKLQSVRKHGGLSGFPKREESEYDLYNTGHAGTSISQVIGEAIARDILHLKHKCVCVIGDASIASGMALEALNHGGHAKTDCLVILNDNDMSISKNVGAINQYLNRLITSPFYDKWRKFWYNLVLWIPLIGPAMQLLSRKLEKSFKDFLTPGSLFSDFGFRYIGPVDGHDIVELVRTLRHVSTMKGPVLLHAYTQKGKGFVPAEKNPITYHSVTNFNRADGSFAKKAATNQIGFSEIVGQTLIEICERNSKVTVITPAMIEGSGLRALYDKYPQKVHDVGIAEQHSMSFAGALAAGGAIPYLCIYSTFLNRALDQLIQDVGLMRFPVRMVVDRAGCVGPDGETHQGLYDIGMLLAVPNVAVYAPASGAELKGILNFMESYDRGPIAVRFPKAACLLADLEKPVDVTSLKAIPSLSSGKEVLILAVGTMWETALEVEKRLKSDGMMASVLGIRWIRPLDIQQLNDSIAECEKFVILEDSYIFSGASSYLLQQIDPHLLTRFIKTFAFPEQAIEHGTRDEVFRDYGLDAESLTKAILATKSNSAGKVYATTAQVSEM